jgi:Family of unknown function (DUF5996)
MTIGHSLSKDEMWPALPLAEWNETRQTLHMWTQIVGKVRLALSPRVNQWWEVPLYVCARGLTTSPIPYGTGIFEVNFDFVSHTLEIVTSWNEKKTIHLFTRTVAGFYREFMDALHSLGITVKIWPMPVEIPNPIRFDQDVTHARYDPAYVHRFWRILVTVDAILKEFRAGFIGKASPVHFFWGSFDLAASRFSGRLAPPKPGADPITREAYSHEVISAGWWPGAGDVTAPFFYAYAVPDPAGFRDAPVKPAKAVYNTQLNEFLLAYDDVRSDADPKAALMAFLQSTYDAGATLGKWDRTALEKHAT